MLTYSRAVLLTLLLPALAAACPDVRPMEGLDLAEWTRASWYIAEQQINGYQSAEDLYCVVATYLNETEEKKKVYVFHLIFGDFFGGF
jgi:hypothetical protein